MEYFEDGYQAFMSVLCPESSYIEEVKGIDGFKDNSKTFTEKQQCEIGVIYAITAVIALIAVEGMLIWHVMNPVRNILVVGLMNALPEQLIQEAIAIAPQAARAA